MNGLTSREALAHRQARWVQDIDREVRSNPVQTVFNRDSLYNSARDKPSIISVMSDDYDSIAMDSNTALRKRDGISTFVNENQADQLDSLQKLYDSLNERLIKLEKSHESLEENYESVEETCSVLKEDYGSLKEDNTWLKTSYESLKKSIPDTSALIFRIQKLEEHCNRTSCNNPIIIGESPLGCLYNVSPTILTSTSNSILNPPTPILDHITTPKAISTLSTITVPQPTPPKIVQHIIPPKIVTQPIPNLNIPAKPELKNIREFIPYMIKEEYAGRDNTTRLSGNDFDMVVEIIGRHTEPFVIFPFGSETNLPEYSSCLLEFTCDGINSIKGFFGRGIDRVYTIRLEDEFKIKILNHTFPLVLKCKANLV